MNVNRVFRIASVVSCAAIIAAPQPAVHAQRAPTVPTWRLTEVWREDGTRGGEPLADPRDLAILKDEMVWLLDFKDQRIRRFDANGKELKGIGRLGSGPGELKNANGLLAHPNGTIWVNDPRNARISVFGSDGRLVRGIVMSTWGWGMRWDAWTELATGRVADPRTIGSAQSWQLISALGKPGETLTRPSCSGGRVAAPVFYKAETKKEGSMMGSYPFTTGGGSAPNGRGAMWCADEHSRTVALVRIGRADTIARTTVDLPPVKVSLPERDSVVAKVRTMLNKYTTNDFDMWKVPSQKPGIAALSVDYDGRLWVLHSHVFRETGPTFDVHDSTGVHLGRVTLPHPLYQDAYGVIRARGNALWLVVVDEDGVPSLVRYKITR